MKHDQEKRIKNLWVCWSLTAVAILFLLNGLAPTAASTQSSSAQAASASPDQINELCERYDAVARRITTAREGLRSIKRQMAGQGLQLRGDILEAESRMQSSRDQAREAITHYDLDAAGSDLPIAEAAVESIERFLGR